MQSTKHDIAANIDGGRKQGDAIALLHSISETLNSKADISEVFSRVLDILKNLLDFPAGMLTILNRSDGSIFIEDSFGMDDADIGETVYQLGEGIIGQVVESGHSEFVNDIEQNPRFLNKTGLGGEYNSFIAIPIRYGEEILGAIGAFCRKDARDDFRQEIQLMEIVASMMARAVRLYRSMHEENSRLREENERLQSRLLDEAHDDRIIGNSKGMRQVHHLVNKIAPTETTTLILGDSGVGKELVAQAIFSRSKRSDKPFFRFNCAALPEGMAETELFGHEKGAFTGADKRRLGLFLAADGGTIFLDEVGELSLNVQTKLLRVLQNGEFQPVGSDFCVECDVRIIAATNRDLEEQVKKGNFREDLFYRLNVFPVTVPSLKDRKTDIPLLTDFFIAKYSERLSKPIARISTAAIDMLMSYHWPGNVRELENCIERAVILAESDTIHGYDLPPTLQVNHPSSNHFSKNFEATIEAIEKDLIIEELKAANGNVRNAANQLGLSYRKLGLRLKKYHIEYQAYRSPKRP